MSSIGNYKGVMLCNRPTQLKEPEKAKPFISRVDPKDQLGTNPPAKKTFNTKRKPNMALAKHKHWLQKIQSQRNQQAAQEQEQEALKTSKRKNFSKSMDKQRKKLLEISDPVEKAKFVSKDKPKISPELYNTVNNFDKPKWAMTQEENEQHEEKEVDNLLKFVEELDYDKYIEDLEVKHALEVIKNRVTKIIQEKPELKEKAFPKTVHFKQPQPKPPKEEPAWDTSTNPESKEDKYLKEAKKIADKILKEQPNLKNIHSNSSIRQLIMESLNAEPPKVTVVNEGPVKKNVIDASNLPYLHRNPAI